MTTRPDTTLTLSAALFGFVFLCALAFASVSAGLVLDRISRFQNEVLNQAVTVRGTHAGTEFARTLNDLWETLQAIRRDPALSEPSRLRGALEAVVGDGRRVSWAGFARTDGVVVAASNGLLEGVDVSTRPWFQRGLAGDFAGDVHEAVLLNGLLGGSDSDPFRFLDLAGRVIGPDGEVAGVIGFHIDFDWAKAYLGELARELGLDLFLVNQSGEVIVATAAIEGDATGLQALRAAAAAAPARTVEMWPDGVVYHAVVLPDVTYGNLPSFGWRLVARIAPTTFDEARTALVQTAFLLLLAAGAALLLLTTAFSGWFLRPVRLLAENAQKIAAGADDYPLETRRTAELAGLSAALARLQGRAGAMPAQDNLDGKEP